MDAGLKLEGARKRVVDLHIELFNSMRSTRRT